MWNGEQEGCGSKVQSRGHEGQEAPKWLTARAIIPHTGSLVKELVFWLGSCSVVKFFLHRSHMRMCACNPRKETKTGSPWDLLAASMTEWVSFWDRASKNKGTTHRGKQLRLTSDYHTHKYRCAHTCERAQAWPPCVNTVCPHLWTCTNMAILRINTGVRTHVSTHKHK